METANKLLVILQLTCVLTYAQVNDYNFSRKINDPQQDWHKMILPDEIFSKVSSTLSDLRIKGIIDGTDTIEAPYFLTELKETEQEIIVPFKLINTSNKNDEYYFTFETSSDETINRIKLDFSQKNFDWLATLEGSQDLNEWFTIKKDNRIVSFSNTNADYKYTFLDFTDSKFQYYRVQIKSNTKPNLLTAHLTKQIIKTFTQREYSSKIVNTTYDNRLKQSRIEVELNSVLPVSSIKISIKDMYDFYRPLTIQVVTDSFKTQNGWQNIYEDIYSGVLSSFDNREFNFETVLSKKIIIIINNNDNEPLQVDRVEVKGNVFELTARFDKDAVYYLVYGNENAGFPKYDIDNFKDKIPGNLSYLTLDSEEIFLQDDGTDIKPLFENKLWLWVIMIVMIVLIGWFSLGMMRRKK